MDHTIKRVETIPVSLPLIKPVLMGDNQEIRSSDSLLVRLETASGVTGLSLIHISEPTRQVR
jgi:hypothetical protein